MEINDRVIEITLQKRNDSSEDLRTMTMLANMYDLILYENPVDMMAKMNTPEDEMLDMLEWLVLYGDHPNQHSNKQ